MTEHDPNFALESHMWSFFMHDSLPQFVAMLGMNRALNSLVIYA
jgi:hypothetical protein